MKKVLIITYYWPPAGGPGVQRWLKFVKYLPEHHIHPIVYCPKNPSYPTLDHTLSKEVDSKITVLKHPIKEPLRFLKMLFKTKTNTLSKGGIPDSKKQGFFERFLLFVRGNFFVPDARIFWVKPSIKFLSSYISKHQIDTIITTGPPHSVHLIGMQLKTQHHLQWYADFRDPWTDISYHKNLNFPSKTSIFILVSLIFKSLLEFFKPFLFKSMILLLTRILLFWLEPNFKKVSPFSLFKIVILSPILKYSSISS